MNTMFEYTYIGNGKRNTKNSKTRTHVHNKRTTQKNKET